MVYSFVCPVCKKVFERNIPMSKYDEEKNKQFCEYDKEKLERAFEKFDGNIKLSSGMYGTGNGGWNS